MDTTEVVVGILAGALDCPVVTDIPQARPKRLAMVYLDSDSESDEFVMRPVYAVTCWGLSDIDARGIAMSALHALAEAAETHPYLSAALMQNMTRDEWAANGQARYVLTVQTVFNIE